MYLIQKRNTHRNSAIFIIVQYHTTYIPRKVVTVEELTVYFIL